MNIHTQAIRNIYKRINTYTYMYCTKGAYLVYVRWHTLGIHMKYNFFASTTTNNHRAPPDTNKLAYMYTCYMLSVYPVYIWWHIPNIQWVYKWQTHFPPPTTTNNHHRRQKTKKKKKKNEAVRSCGKVDLESKTTGGTTIVPNSFNRTDLSQVQQRRR